ncbi:MAG: hypothetical protein AMS25_05000 [Gemmatimonas sp. SM23_52]|nr:MAG: hypothetical protein AMS25_05000 [Gemmatimonas sp. SM23_52]
MAREGPADVTRLTIARLHYSGGGDWYANPSSLPNLLERIRRDTRLPVAGREAVVTPLSPDLYDYPYLYMTGHGNVRFSEEELSALRRYLAAGGFLHADDNYGMDASFRREVQRLFPDHELVQVPLDHAIYRIVHSLPDGLPKVHEHDGLPAEGLGLFRDGRLVIFYSYQSDLGDGWEDPEVHGDPAPIREQALKAGVNLFAYAVAQRKPL